ncbi:uncharacterized protein PV09_09776 [Verruconis gallopava]|uniref:Uncharacterized protein n=1 Tax=Verruconis gallopava TaxID=253628 RepID=A0A0D2AHI4_9PEZI|nr:uncharacterized protein PV09_09776 [Verruconis gallopava]KIV98393.1 hypothetical protein PV09_09776 [Verruconis gallopava]
MLGYNKLKIRPLVNTDVPSKNNVDQATRKQGTHPAIDPRSRIESAKKMPTPDISIIQQQREWENTQLRNELQYQRRKHGASMYLLEEVRLVVKSLQEALVNFEKLNSAFEDEVTDE